MCDNTLSSGGPCGQPVWARHFTQQQHTLQYITSKPCMYNTLSTLRSAWILQHQNENSVKYVLIGIEMNVGECKSLNQQVLLF